MVSQFHELLFRLIELLLSLCICHELSSYSQKFLHVNIICSHNELYATNLIIIFVKARKKLPVHVLKGMCQYQSNVQNKLAYFYLLIKKSVLSF